MKQDLENIRKFSLVAAVLLFSYSIAGIKIAEGEQISLVGIPFTVSNPELLPIGLVLMSLYGLIRFYYYGIMLFSTPYRTRRDLFDGLRAEGLHRQHWVSKYLGRSLFTTTPSINDRRLVEANLSKILEAFPKIWGQRVQGKVVSFQSHDSEGELSRYWHAEVTIPIACRGAAYVQDIDYTAPIWTNLVALAVAGTTMGN